MNFEHMFQECSCGDCCECFMREQNAELVAVRTQLAEAQDKIERYERALQHYACTISTVNGQTIVVYGDSGAIAREALNPKEGA